MSIEHEITQHNHDLLMHQAQIDMNSDFRINWPKEGLLAADVQQNSRLDAIEGQNSEQATDLRDIQKSINEIKVTLGILESRSAVAEQKTESLYTLYNSKLTEAK
jgi:hypothetical protein